MKNAAVVRIIAAAVTAAYNIDDAKSLRTIAAPRQKLMNARATLVATTTFAVVELGLLEEESVDIEDWEHPTDHCKLKSMTDTTAADLARSLVLTLRAHSHAAYWVGGCVRDLLLKIVPKDYDIATSATPAEVLALLPDAQQVGAHFGVVLVAEAGVDVEVAPFRSDDSYLDGRHPGEVRFETDPRQDVLRRDFTINALLMDPESGEVLDWVGGKADLRDGVIRAIGEPARRFEEDHLRMLRAVRFAARFGYTIEPATFAAIREQSAKIQRISAERIRDEFTRILTVAGERRGFHLLDGHGCSNSVPN